MLKHLYILGTLLLTVYGQIVIKARARVIGEGPDTGTGNYLLRMFTDIAVISGFAAAVLAATSWLLAVRYFDVAYAYPFMALSFVFVPFLGWILFGETLSWQQMAGSALIVGGITIHALAR